MCWISLEKVLHKVWMSHCTHNKIAITLLQSLTSHQTWPFEPFFSPWVFFIFGSTPHGWKKGSISWSSLEILAPLHWQAKKHASKASLNSVCFSIPLRHSQVRLEDLLSHDTSKAVRALLFQLPKSLATLSLRFEFWFYCTCYLHFFGENPYCTVRAVCIRPSVWPVCLY